MLIMRVTGEFIGFELDKKQLNCIINMVRPLLQNRIENLN